ncbi:MAG: VPLPA-CTERM sorting domain-containing protein [Paucibacter sp.]|nr:VPLPA-CTERM sorting domain-containing protein [Roseateles sp.]
MKNIFIGASLALIATANASATTTLNFDDLSGDPTQAITAGYGGFDWQTLATITAAELPASGYANAVVSGLNAAYNWDGGAVSIRWAGAGTVDFAGAFFTSAWQEQELVFEGWQGGVLKHSTPESIGVTTDAPLWIALNWAGIDELRIYNSANHWAMDNFSFSPTAAVPEPATAWLTLAGLAGLALRARRRNKPA